MTRWKGTRQSVPGASSAEALPAGGAWNPHGSLRPPRRKIPPVRRTPRRTSDRASLWFMTAKNPERAVKIRRGARTRVYSMENTTARIVDRFITAFRERDPSLIPELVAESCVMEGMQPAPDGLRVEGYADNVRFWQAMVADTRGTFETEETVILEDRAINRWRYTYGDRSSVRGVTLIRVEDGRIVEALGYGKTPAPDVDTAHVIRRFNDVFQRHDPGALVEIVSAD